MKDILSHLDRLDQQAATILGRHPKVKRGTRTYSEEEISDALLAMFERTGVTTSGTGGRQIEKAILFEMLNLGLISTHIHKDTLGRHTVFTLTQDGHRVRVKRLSDDIELSHHVMQQKMHEIAEAEREAAAPSAAETSAIMGMAREAAGLLLKHHTAAAEGRIEEFTSHNYLALVTVEQGHLDFLHGMEGGEALIDLIVHLRRELSGDAASAGT